MLKDDAVLAMQASASLHTKEELEAADKEAQSAKLQELLRRGTPADLAAANDLMKEMAGFYHDKVPNYEQKAEQELENVEKKAKELIQCLSTLKAGDNVSNDRQIQELVAVMRTAQPKITKSIEEDAGDTDSDAKINRLLYLNDLINECLTKYETCKKGGAASLKSGATVETTRINVPSSTSVSPGKSAPPVKQEVSLIDFDDFGGSSTAGPPPPAAVAVSGQNSKPVGDLLGDLAGLSFAGPSMGGQAPPPYTLNPGPIRLDSSIPEFFTANPAAARGGPAAVGALSASSMTSTSPNKPPSMIPNSPPVSIGMLLCCLDVADYH